MVDISFVVAFVAGLLSFLSPCVLPIVPGFLAYLSGSASASVEDANRWKLFVSSAFFVLGFSTVFAVLGVLLNTVLLHVASDVQTWLARIGGVIVIFFGLYLTGLIRVGFLERSHTVGVTQRFSSVYVTSFLFGAAFASGWTPCVGAALGAIIGLAASNPASALGLFFSYAIGLGVPFLAVGLFASRAEKLFGRYARFLTILNVVFGAILIILGVLVFTESLNVIANFGFLNSFLLR